MPETDPPILPGERLEILQYRGLVILQHGAVFRFGTDSILLADFATVKTGDRVADLGTGTGILPILLAARTRGTTFDAVEIQPQMADMARRSVLLNRLDGRIRVLRMDLMDAPGQLGHECYQAVICNPPYGKRAASLHNPDDGLRIARHEGDVTISDIARTAGTLLKSGGRFSLVFPSSRMPELFGALREHHLEPKRLRAVCTLERRSPKLILVEAVKNARPGLVWLPQLVVRNADGTETEEIERIYHRGVYADDTPLAEDEM